MVQELLDTAPTYNILFHRFCLGESWNKVEERERVMATRKSFIGPPREDLELDRLEEAARKNPATDDQLKEQRASFVYGNAPSDSRITKESAQTASDSVRIRG